MSRILVVYGTKTGCTAGVAERIGETLAELGASVEVAPAADAPSASGFDAVAVGSGVRAGNWHGSAKSWVAGNADALKGMPIAMFTVGLTLASDPEKLDEVRAYTDSLVAEAGITPVDIGLFKGCNEPKKFSLPERMILKALKSPEGDFREMDVVTEWARTVAPKLGVSS